MPLVQILVTVSKILESGIIPTCLFLLVVSPFKVKIIRHYSIWSGQLSPKFSKKKTHHLYIVKEIAKITALP